MNWQFEKNRIYSINDKDELMAEVTFVYKNETEVIIDHTYVNPVLRGQGVASEMLVIVMEYFRKSNYIVSATCSYANAWIRKHREEYKDMISTDFDDAAIACKI